VSPGSRARLAAAAVIATVAVAAVALTWADESALRRQATAQQQLVARLEHRVRALEARSALDVDWRATAASVRLSVVTIDAGDALGSGWVAHADARGSDIVTNYHVIAGAWTSGVARVDIREADSTFAGTVVRVDVTDDLAVVHTSHRLAALASAGRRPDVGTTVMAVGSPLGLSGTVSVGVVSGYRSLDGSDYMQFSAPISPGNSGGPVVDGAGHVVAVASAKLIGDGVEGLSLGIPAEVVCGALVTCATGD
jgi:putative serine protease PepD